MMNRALNVESINTPEAPLLLAAGRDNIGDVLFAINGFPGQGYKLVRIAQDDSGKHSIIDSTDISDSSGRGITALKASHDGGTLYVGHWGPAPIPIHEYDVSQRSQPPTISRISNTESGGFNFDLSPDGSKLYGSSSQAILTFDTVSGTSTSEPIEETAVYISVSPNRNEIYGTDGYNSIQHGRAHAFDAQSKSIKWSVQLGLGSSENCTSPDGKFLYVCNPWGEDQSLININDISNLPNGTVSVVDVADQSVKTIPVSQKPMGIIAHPNGRFVYVNSPGVTMTKGYVDVIDVSTREVQSIETGSGGYSIALSLDGKYLYSANVIDSSISVIDTTKNSVIDIIEPPEENCLDLYVKKDGSFHPLMNYIEDRILAKVESLISGPSR